MTEEEYSNLGEPMKVSFLNKHGNKLKCILGLFLTIIMVAILAAVVIFIILFNPNETEKNNFPIEWVTNGVLSPTIASPIPLQKSGNFIYWKRLYKYEKDNINKELTSCELVLFDVKSNNESPYKPDMIKKLNIQCGTPIVVSPSEEYILIPTLKGTMFRRIVFNNYRLFELTGDYNLVKEWNGYSAKFCPATENNRIAYVDENFNLQWTEGNDFTFTQVNENSGDNIFHGLADFLYNEDVIGRQDSFEFDRDCSAIGYVQVDDTKVNITSLPIYDPKEIDTSFFRYPYPKPGQENPAVSVFVKEIGKTVQNYPVNEEDYHYIYDMGWDESHNFMIVGIPRVQSKVFLAAVSPGKPTESQKVFDCADSRCYYVFYQGFVTFGDQETVMILPNDDYYHLKYYNMKNNAENQYLNKNGEQIAATKIVGIDSSKRVLYQYNIISTTDSFKNPPSTYQKLRYVSIKDRTEEPLQEGDNTYSTAILSPTSSYVFLSILGPEIPSHKVITKDAETEIKLNGHLEDVLKQIPNYRVSDSSEGVLRDVVNDKFGENYLDHIIFKPPGFVEPASYPGLQYQYGGPGVKIVNQAFTTLYNPWALYLAINQSIVYTMVDLRGSTGRRISFSQSQYRQLGVPQLEDSINFATDMKRRAYIDEKKYGVWGWSFGGFMALTSASSGNFSVAMSVAPVTDWRYYDSSYTERYMLEPQDNAENYVKTSILHRLRQNPKPFKDTKILISHGLQDTNVHPKNSLDVLAYMQQNDIPVDVMYYPNKDHSIANVHPFLYHKLSEYIEDNLK